MSKLKQFMVEDAYSRYTEYLRDKENRTMSWGEVYDIESASVEEIASFLEELESLGYKKKGG